MKLTLSERTPKEIKSKMIELGEHARRFEEKHKHKDKRQPEQSIVIRVLSTFMAFLVITLACYYANTSLGLTLAYLSLTLIGSYLAYVCRAERSAILSIVAIVGVIIVVVAFSLDLLAQLASGRLQIVELFIQAIAGLYALHMFDLRTRSEVNASVLIGITCLAATALLGSEIVFGIGVLIFVISMAVLFQFECMEPTEEIEIASPGQDLSHSGSIASDVDHLGSALAVAMLIPCLALSVFVSAPRLPSLVDRLKMSAANWKTPPFSFAMTMPLAPKSDSLRLGGTGSAGSLMSGSQTAKSLSRSADKPNGDQNLAEAMLAKVGLNAKVDLTSKVGSDVQDQAGKGSAQHGRSYPDIINKNDQRFHYSLADKATEEEMTLKTTGKAAAASADPLLFLINSSREIYLKRLSFDYFDGQNWRAAKHPRQVSLDCNPDLYAILDLHQFEDKPTPMLEVTQEIEAVAPLGHIVPAAWIPKMIAFPAEKIYLDEYGTIRVTQGIEPGTKFKIISKMPLYPLEQLRHFEVDQAAKEKITKLLEADLQIPQSQSDQVSLLARGLTENRGTWFTQAEVICQHLRKNYQYSTDFRPAVPSKNLVDAFLFETRQGDCSHFASAFVLLCRSLGIPARCIGGFAPGTRNYLTGRVEVHALQTHAWAEVYIPSFGWVPFDAVPAGYLPDQKPAEALLAQLTRAGQLSGLPSLFGGGSKSFTDKRTLSKGENQSKERGGTATANDTDPSAHLSTSQDAGGGRESGSAGSVDRAADSRHRQLQADIFGKSRRFDLGTLKDSPKSADRAPLDWRVKDVFHLPQLDHLNKNWPIVALIVLLTLACIVQLIRHRRAVKAWIGNIWSMLTVGKSAPAGTRVSTRLYLRVIKDLSKIRYTRGIADTPEDVVAQVASLIASSSADKKCPTDLPLLLREFMEKYAANRFDQKESPDLCAELAEIGHKIHEILVS
jgi:hypothetical protein